MILYAKIDKNKKIINYPYRNHNRLNTVQVETPNKPKYDKMFEAIKYEPPVFNEELGKWTGELTVVKLPESYAAKNVRWKRDNLLKETDWRFRSDLNPSQEWTEYCQALRDITDQDGFPFNVIWPTKPE